MKQLTLIALAMFLIGGLTAQNRDLPDVQVTTLNGRKVRTSQLSNDGNPIVISFWATWCSPCKRELNNIAEMYPSWQEKTGVKLVAVSVDDMRSRSRVRPYVNSSGWDYDVYIDDNQEFKRALNVNNVPHTFLVNGDGEVVWQHNNYAPGDEYELYDQIKKLVK